MVIMNLKLVKYFVFFFCLKGFGQKDTILYQNGKIKQIAQFDSGEYAGFYKDFYESGQIKTEGEYQKVNPDSITTQVFKAIYCKSLRIGKWKEYFENGKLKSKGKYYFGVHQT